MQNRYVADVADFGKYGLLRYLTRPDPKRDKTDFKLGVVWYFQPDEVHGADGNRVVNDGRHTSYLDDTEEKRQRFGACDLSLWKTLGRLFMEGRRCVHCTEKARVLPAKTAFFGAILHFINYMTINVRRAVRDAWLTAALVLQSQLNWVRIRPLQSAGEGRSGLGR